MKEIVKSDKAPEPIGPYNQAILSNGTLYISGQIAIDSGTGIQIHDDIKAETHQVMQNLGAILKTAGMGFEQVVKSSIFIVDMEDFSSVNEVYGQFFDEDKAPARETVAVSKLPKNARVEISMIAVL